MNTILLIISAAFLILWGIAHIIPTRSVVVDFGDISEDNKRILMMEWINEGLTLIFLGVLIILSALLGDIEHLFVMAINMLVCVMLIAMSVLSIFTGFKVNFIPYKLCPVIFTISALLIILGTFI